MATKPEPPRERKKHVTAGGRIREQVYLSPDEEEALETFAAKLRASKSEVLRRALRRFCGID
jgi:hypothetical protein